MQTGLRGGSNREMFYVEERYSCRKTMALHGMYSFRLISKDDWMVRFIRFMKIVSKIIYRKIANIVWTSAMNAAVFQDAKRSWC